VIRIKICGITRSTDAEVAIRAGADMVGFVFVPHTPRAVVATDLGWARQLTGVDTVGVFRDAPLEEILATRELLALDWVQLHGNEPDSMIDVLGERVVRRVPTAGGVDWQRVAQLAVRCLPLIDPGAGHGTVCDWSSLAERPHQLDLGLAGGLSSDNVAEAIRTVRPALVDVSSGVESTPGIKDHHMIRAFVSAVRAAE
jgi:phosphoribosylanthranilate isomerase